MNKNLKIIYGLDLIVFGIVLACHLFIDKFNFNDYWLVFLVAPSLVDIILNKINAINVSLFVISTSILGYFIFNNIWVALITFVILVGLLLVIVKPKQKEVKTENKNGPF